ncbi:MAG TPA: hypothetical protein VKC60_14285 [Opitutaceae bacterium]|nr:hypothetical protein [Opitutaceae bacterium]
MHVIVIHYPFLILALILLWMPRQLLRFGKFGRSRRQAPRVGLPFLRKDTNGMPSNDDPNDRSLGLFRELKKKRNLLDFARACIGGLTLTGGIWGGAITLGPNPPPGRETELVFLFGIISGIGVLIQTVRFEKRISLFPPVFYLSGLTFGLYEPLPAAFGLLLIWVANILISNPSAFLLFYGLLLGAFGLLFKIPLENVTIVLVLIWTPPVLSALMRKRLVIINRKVKQREVAA